TRWLRAGRVCRYSRAASLFHFGVGAFAAVRDEAIDARLKYGNRHRSQLEHGIVEGAEIEFIAECFFRLGAGFQDRVLAQVVRQGLRGPGDVSINLGVDLML